MNSDQCNMARFLEQFPEQIEKALEISKNVKISGDFDKLVVTGIGGSTLPGDLLGLCLPDLKIPVVVNRDYDLPKGYTEKTLVFASSYSGNTEEPLHVFRSAKNKNLKMVGFFSGGQLELMCKDDHIPYVKYPKEAENFQPRFALGYSFISMLNVLQNSDLIGDKKIDITTTIQVLKDETNQIREQAKHIAKKLVGKTPIIYSSEKMKQLAYIWKINFNENSKTPAFYNSYPELNHNEMVGYTNPQAKFHIITLKDKTDYHRITKRMEITPKVIKSEKVDSTTLDLGGGSLITRIFRSVYLSMWTSYYLALEYEIDPTPVKMVENLKQELK